MEKIQCPLCKIKKEEKLIYQDDLIYLVNTKNKKGHSVRVMVCLNRHFKKPTFEEISKSYIVLYEYMKHKLRKKSWIIFSDKYASIPNHWHLIASDNKTLDKTEIKNMEKTPKLILPLKLKFEEF